MLTSDINSDNRKLSDAHKQLPVLASACVTTSKFHVVFVTTNFHVLFPGSGNHCGSVGLGSGQLHVAARFSLGLYLHRACSSHDRSRERDRMSQTAQEQ